MKSKANNRLISRLLCTCTMDSHILMVGEDEGLLNDDEANVLMISYMIEAVRNCKRVIRIISDDTNANYNKVTFRNYTLLLERRQAQKKCHEDLLRTGQNFFVALYGQPKCSSMSTVYDLY